MLKNDWKAQASHGLSVLMALYLKSQRFIGLSLGKNYSRAFIVIHVHFERDFVTFEVKF